MPLLSKMPLFLGSEHRAPFPSCLLISCEEPPGATHLRPARLCLFCIARHSRKVSGKQGVSTSAHYACFSRADCRHHAGHCATFMGHILTECKFASIQCQNLPLPPPGPELQLLMKEILGYCLHWAPHVFERLLSGVSQLSPSIHSPFVTECVVSSQQRG